MVVGFLYIFMCKLCVSLFICKSKKFTLVFGFVAGVEFDVIVYLIELVGDVYVCDFAIVVYD